MTTQTQDPSSSHPNIKPLLNKYADIPNTTSLSIIKKRNEKFRSLTIQVKLWKAIKEEPTASNNMKKVLKRSKTLRHFRLNGSQYPSQSQENSRQFVESAIVRLVESLKNHLALVKTDFFFGEKIKGLGKVWNILARCLSRVVLKMKDFSFGSMFYVDDEKMRSRLRKRGLRRLRFLQNITLKYPWTYGVKADPLAHWGKSFFEYKRLKSLSLEMFPCISAQDDILENITECLQKFHCLKNIHINFNLGFNKVTSNGFKRLLEGISQMPFLESLSLAFPHCLKFTNDCLKILGENLTKILTLKRVDLNLDICQKLNNEGVEILSKCLQQLTGLTFLKLNLSRCRNIHTQGLRALGEVFKNLKLLKEVHLIFECCQLIDIKDVQNFAWNFKDKSFSLHIIYQQVRDSEKISIKNSDLLERKEEIDPLGIFEDELFQ